MVLQSELYPGVGYQQQQGYEMHQPDYYSTTTEYYSNVSPMPMAPSPFVPTPQHSNHQMLANGPGGYYGHGWNGKNTHPNVWPSTIDHYSHGSHAPTSPYGNYSNGTAHSGYGTYHDAHYVPMPGNVEVVRYQYSTCGDGRERCPTFPTAPHNAYQTAEWTFKSVD